MNNLSKIPSNTQSPQSLVLRFMREKRKLTVLFVGKEIGMKPKNVDHVENGRKILTADETLLFLNLYNYSLETFNEMLEIKPLNKRAANHYFLTRPQGSSE
jgi:transcriptional regulator with XRE-family HTH domain